VKDMLYP